MKIYICFTLIAAAVVLQLSVAAVLDHKDVNTKINFDVCAAFKLYIKSLKGIMACGYDPLLIPALIPFYQNRYSFKFMNVAANISDFWLHGLNDIKILHFDCNSISNNIAFDILIPKVQTLAQYDISSETQFPFLPFELGGKGLLDTRVNNLRFVGHIHWENAQSVQVTEFKLNFYVGSFEYNNRNFFLSDLMNTYFNKWANEVSMVAVQEVQKHMDWVYALFFFPQVNNELQNVTMCQVIDFFLSRSMEMGAAKCRN